MTVALDCVIIREHVAKSKGPTAARHRRALRVLSPLPTLPTRPSLVRMLILTDQDYALWRRDLRSGQELQIDRSTI